MMFSLRKFIKGGLLKAVGNMADYQVILNAAAWYEKGVLLEEDLVEIQNAIGIQHTEEVDEMIRESEPVEEGA